MSNGIQQSKVIKEILQIKDVQVEEKQYTKMKFEKEFDINLINMEARNAFQNGISITKLKCYYDFNVVGVRDNMINKGTILKECPKCREDETQEHVILYKDNRVKRAEFIYNLERKLPKIANGVINLEEVVMIINDIRSYLI